MLPTPGDESVEFVLVDAFHRDRVDLDRKSGGLSGKDAVQRRLDLAPASDLREAGRIEAASSILSLTEVGGTPQAADALKVTPGIFLCGSGTGTSQPGARPAERAAVTHRPKRGAALARTRHPHSI